MNRYTSTGIMLARTNYGEADRIYTFLTPTYGKVQAIAKGVRKQKSKLAGGIELFSVSHLTLLVGRSEINTLMSTRIDKHYGNIVSELARSDAAYEMIRLSHKATEENPEQAYFDLLKQGFESLDDLILDPGLTLLWFQMRLLKLTGHTPNLQTDATGSKLKDGNYVFDIDHMRFAHSPSGQGIYSPNHIKLLRLGFSAASPRILQRVNGRAELVASTGALIQTMLKTVVRI